jgi:gliding motility-associated-like protein
MKKKCLFFKLLIIVIKIKSQNLVPNSGFDELTICPNFYGQIQLAFPWTKASSEEISVFNSCSSVIGLSVPNAGGYINSYQLPKSGNGYTGLMVYRNDNANLLNYLETPLLKPLEKNKHYFIEFYVSPDLSSLDYWRYTDAVGLALSDTFYYKVIQPHQALPLEPIIENRGKLIKDTIGWTRISGCYTAKGNEKYAIIGNFRNDSETMIEVENPLSYPYYNFFFIEDVLIQEFDPLQDTMLICEGEQKILNAGFLDAKYKWNDGSTDSTITIQSPGIYIVEAIMDNCSLFDTVVIVSSNSISNFPNDTAVCKEQQFSLVAPVNGVYLWSDGSTKNNLKIENSGQYSLTVTNECGEFIYTSDVEVKECDCKFYIPNSFSPNSDGQNDELIVFSACDFDLKIKFFAIYDRWGNNLYSKNENDEIKWDGFYRGKQLPSGVYSWFLEYEYIKNGITEELIKKGDISIFR